MMMKQRRGFLFLLLLTACLWLTAAGSGRGGGGAGDDGEVAEERSDLESAQPTLALVGGWLIDGTSQIPYEDAVVLIAGDRIKAVGRRDQVSIPPKVDIIDARGKAIVPGIIDAHNHLEGLGLGDDDREFTNTPEKLKQVILRNARLDLLSGVTTIREMGSSEMVLELREQIEAVGPRLFAAGPQLVKKDSEAPVSPNFIEFDGVKDAKKKVRRQIDKGVDLIKVRLTVQRELPSLKELKAIVDTAHKADLKVAVHTDVPHQDAVQLAIEARVDTIEHSALLRAGSDPLFREAAEQDIVLVPTLFQLRAQHIDPLLRSDDDLIEPPLVDRLPAEWLQGLRQRAAIWREAVNKWRETRGYDPEEALRAASDSVIRAQSLGVKLAIGPDTGSDLVPHGRIYRDLEFYAKAGVTPMQVIQMYAKNGAQALGQEKMMGTIEPGKLADILILDGDPLFDMSAFRNLVLIIKNGRVVKSSAAQ